MKLGWYVFMHCSDGGVAPITRFWSKRTAQRWADQFGTEGRRLEVHRYGWRGRP